jgi:hypothetical protein
MFAFHGKTKVVARGRRGRGRKRRLPCSRPRPRSGAWAVSRRDEVGIDTVARRKDMIRIEGSGSARGG